MSIHVNEKYNGVVAPGSGLYETTTGTIGYQVMLECEDGKSSYVIWLTPKNRERAEKCFAVLGVSGEQLKNPNFFEYELAKAITGVEVSFGTAEEEYKGKKKVKVSWIGKASTTIGQKVPSVAAQFFGGEHPVEITDDDIPF